jgi:hypothetical protein
LPQVTTDSIKFKAKSWIDISSPQRTPPALAHAHASHSLLHTRLPLPSPQVTTDSIKFKAKSWIDVFGGRASKALGSVVTNTFKKPVTNLMFYGSLVSIAIAFSLILITSALGRAFERFSASGELVGMVRRPGRVRGDGFSSGRDGVALLVGMGLGVERRGMWGGGRGIYELASRHRASSWAW